jgi:hypothetical protein
MNLRVKGQPELGRNSAALNLAIVTDLKKRTSQAGIEPAIFPLGEGRRATWPQTSRHVICQKVLDANATSRRETPCDLATDLATI